MIKKQMVCFDCGMKIEASIVQAKAHGWTVWVGGARCKACSAKDDSISVFIWGGPCKGGGDHSCDGPEYEEALMSTATCSKCGMHQIDYDLLRMP